MPKQRGHSMHRGGVRKTDSVPRGFGESSRLVGMMSDAISSHVTTTVMEEETEMSPDDWAVVSRLPGNNNCIDCNAKHPEWGSVNFGILFCTRCCSAHQSLGTHISRVRSVRMDAWTERQVKVMKVGGNESCQDWFSENGITSSSHKIKYDNEVARLYQEVLRARMEGQREPKSMRDAIRLKRWNAPREWWNRIVKGEDPNGNVTRERKNLMHRIRSITSSSDFWLFAYACSLGAWAILFVAWNFPSVFFAWIHWLKLLKRG